jgi:Zn-dependent peptidase ImmA (M78 family)/transcriptional regulator with XRE-family HTH domain
MAERKRPITNIIEFQNDRRVAPLNRLIPSRLREARQATRMTQGDLGGLVGKTRQAISAFETGEKSPDPSTFTRIVDVLEQPIPFFVTQPLPVFGEQWPRFFRKQGPNRLRTNEACDILGRWFVQTSKYCDTYVNFPAVHVLEATPSSLTESYGSDEIENIAEASRQRWGLGVGPISNVLALFESHGILVCRHVIDDERIDAFSFWNGERAFIFMASDKESSVRHRYDLAHELGHLILHKWVESEELKDPKILKRIETEANIFARAFLLPRQSFPNEIYTSRLEAFIELKKRWKVSIQSMVYRCLDLEIIDEDQFTNLYKQISFRKWRTKEPLDDPDVLPLEQPKLLRRAIELILKGGRKHPNEVLSDLNFRPTLIENFCNVPRGMLAASEGNSNYG